MTVEDIKKEIVRLQGMAKGIKLETGLLRADINKLEGCIKQDDEAIEARFDEEANKAYQRGYEDGFREGRTRKELSEAQDDTIRVGDIVYDSRNADMEVYVIKEYADGMTFKGLAISDSYSLRKGDVLGVCWKPNYRKTGRHHDFNKILEVLRS